MSSDRRRTGLGGDQTEAVARPQFTERKEDAIYDGKTSDIVFETEWRAKIQNANTNQFDCFYLLSVETAHEETDDCLQTGEWMSCWYIATREKDKLPGK